MQNTGKSVFAFVQLLETALRTLYGKSEGNKQTVFTIWRGEGFKFTIERWDWKKEQPKGTFKFLGVDEEQSK
jgi:hypothetical protein